jgi:GPH family glycoside/pentoside/hexuronide:cation symporter
MKRFSAPPYLAYGLFGLPLALVALPIYVYVPQFYAERFGMSLALIGATLLIARVLDACIDPLMGMWIDRSKYGYRRFILIALPLLACGFLTLFHPPAVTQGPALAWFISTLLLVYLGFSLATIAHQSWGAALTQKLNERSALTATREACGLIGVIVAASLTGWLGLGWLSITFIISLLLCSAVLLKLAPEPVRQPSLNSHWSMMLTPFQSLRFRWLFAVLVVNGIAAAIPATLFLFFAKDQLQLQQYAGLFLIDAALGGTRKTTWRSPHMAAGDAAGGGSICLGVWLVGGCRTAIRLDLHTVRPDPGCRPGVATGTVSSRHPSGRT